MNTSASEREKYNFNPGWLLHVGDIRGAEKANFSDSDWKQISLPRAFNEDEAFKVAIKEMTDSVAWYRKHFRLPRTAKGKKIFIEFEGVRQGADFYINGKHIGLHENGVMAVGFDLTPYLNFNGENIIAVRVDSDWRYKERATGSGFQWNDSNFNANYGGIPKNVWLHITSKLYQTLPLYSNLKTTGVYIYASDIQVKSRKAVINAESEVRNENSKPIKVHYEVDIYDYDGKLVSTFQGAPAAVNPTETITLKASAPLADIHFWSWGYGYLYNVKTKLVVNNKVVDEVVTRTGFRKTRFGEGKVWLNDRVIQLKGYAQRSSNEWPGVGTSVPAWMSDYSNGLMIEHNANLFRWMHITPRIQDIESCDRTGVIQMLPCGDAERDVTDRRWGQRTELMRDVIIYTRNNPSILFYECGNESISREHMIEMRAIRDLYDPHGGRAIGSREMLDIREAEYGGEMLYVNKSEHHPMIQTEYCRDEGLRKYWDEYSYPFHKQGDGPLYKNQDATAYNQNQDMLTVEFIRRWYDLWRERPGTGRRVNSGGAKIIFSDTQTHGRGAENYRRSGVVDPLRIPKDGYYAHKVMWDGWVDVENYHTHIIGHWNYTPEVVKPIYIVSSGDKVELFVNGKSKGFGKQDYRFLFTFDSIQWEKGTIEAVSYNEENKELSRHSIRTVGEPRRLKMTLMHGPKGVYADGADIALVQIEVVDENGVRCPLANDMVKFDLQGPAEWRGGIAQAKDNYVLARELPVECGITRVLLRSMPQAGKIVLKAEAKGLVSDEVTFTTKPIEVKDGLSTYFPNESLPSRFDRGETPLTPSYKDTKVDVKVESATAGINGASVAKSFDDNELSEWKNDGKLNTAWITYKLERRADIDDICIKLTGWRQRSYPLEVYAGNTLIWSGNTERSLGYVHLTIDKPIRTDQITIRLKGSTHDSDAFGQIIEVVEPKAGELDLFKAEGGEKTNNELRIVEVEFLETLNQ
ncbi:sugar-binding domain-containing protein [uncultured Bacteroides sp.]|uniref:glycoside hydrolase family 2 protein n=1 Tax=uncultured Bacteroides sp. TaxID=162156 RepID=UPI00261A3E5D|nr:sugar-binding domain-containing protein [uncultured Bacteroides sp.]